MPSQRISSLDILFHLTMAVKIDTLNHTTVSVRNSVEATELGIWTSQVLISRVTVAEWCTWTPPVVYKRTPWTISTAGSYTEGPDGEMRRKRAARRLILIAFLLLLHSTNICKWHQHVPSMVHALGIHQGTEETTIIALGESNVLPILQKGYNSPDALAWQGCAAQRTGDQVCCWQW